MTEVPDSWNVDLFEVPYSFCTEIFFQKYPPVYIPEYVFEFGAIDVPQEIPVHESTSDTANVILDGVREALTSMKMDVDHVPVFWSFIQTCTWYEKVKDMSSKLLVTGMVFLASLKIHHHRLRVPDLCQSCGVTPPTARKALMIFKEFI